MLMAAFVLTMCVFINSNIHPLFVFIMSFSSCPSRPVLLVLSFSSCPSRPVLLALSFSSCPSRPVLLVLSFSSCPSRPVLLVLSFSSLSPSLSPSLHPLCAALVQQSFLKHNNGLTVVMTTRMNCNRLLHRHQPKMLSSLIIKEIESRSIHLLLAHQRH
jgi:hypothetical protein